MTNPNNPIPDLVLGGNFTVPSYHMLSARGEAQSQDWLHIKGKRMEWLVQPNREASQILCWRDTKGTSQGFGGAILTLKVVGEILKPSSEIAALGIDWDINMYEVPREFKWQGPWSSNTQSLFEDTGYDIQDRVKSWGCIGRGRSWDKGNNPNQSSRTIIEDLVYFDPEPQYGYFDRVKKLAEQLSDELQETLFYYEETFGGSSCGPVNFGKFDKSLKEAVDKES